MKDTKQRILLEGAKLVHLKGFGATGIQEILKAAEVPKGSFYFYFDSKESFGIELIDYFKGYIYLMWDRLMDSEKLSPLESLQSFIEWFIDFNRSNGYKGGCPFGNLGQEMGDVSDRFREKLFTVFGEFKQKIKDQLEKAIVFGELEKDVDTDGLSNLFFSCYQGALIQMKVEQSSESMEYLRTLLFQLIRSKA